MFGWNGECFGRGRWGLGRRHSNRLGLGLGLGRLDLLRLDLLALGRLDLLSRDRLMLLRSARSKCRLGLRRLLLLQLAGHRRLEFAHPTPQRATDLRQSPCSEHEQQDHHQEHDVKWVV